MIEEARVKFEEAEAESRAKFQEAEDASRVKVISFISLISIY